MYTSVTNQQWCLMKNILGDHHLTNKNELAILI
jgi:hypothetical protein